MDTKTVKLNADFGNNVKGDVCSFPSEMADRLISARIKTANGEIAGAVLDKEATAKNEQWLKDHAKSVVDAEQKREAMTAAALAGARR